MLASALKRPTLASDKGLNDTLIDAYGGFPDSVRSSHLLAGETLLMAGDRLTSCAHCSTASSSTKMAISVLATSRSSGGGRMCTPRKC